MESEMDGIFTQQQLNFGKVLILASGHKLESEEIKKLTKSKKVQLVIGGPNNDDIDSFLLFAINNAMLALGLHRLVGADVYRVDGKQASTVLLAFKIGVNFKSVKLTAKNVKDLHNAYLTKLAINQARLSIETAVDRHNKLTALLTKQKTKNNLSTKYEFLNNLAQDYAKDELDLTVKTIQGITKNVW